MAIGLDSFGVTFLARELKDRLLARTIQGVSLGDDRVLTMRLTGKGSADLRFLAEPSLPLLCLARDTGRGPEMPHMPRFEDPLRECTISDVSQIDLDRIVMITARGDAGNMYRLYFELISPFPNLYLTDTEDTVLAVLFRAGTRTRKRILEQGKPYTPPASQNKMHPVDATPQKLQALDWQRDAEIVSRHILGVSPFLSREIVWHAGKSGS
jgi:predicted ribosome quality control (RQC) complex YloA/Tae2 family protein